MDLSVHPTELGLQKFLINVKLESEIESDSENVNVITVTMNVISCALQITNISNDTQPYFGKLALSKLFHRIK